MATPDDTTLAISWADLEHHVVKYGLDVFPPPDMRADMTHAQDLFHSLREEWPHLYQDLSLSPERNEFRIEATFSGQGKTARFPTLVFTARGPVFAYPLLFPKPIGQLNHKADFDDIFWKSFRLLKKSFPTIQVLRLGLINEAVFNTGKTNFVPYLASRFGSFPGAKIVGGSVSLTFQDERCNVRVKLETIEIRRQVQTAAVGRVVSEEINFGLQVSLDVNNIEIRPQNESDILLTLERGHCLWSEALLQFINSRVRGSSNAP